jgi:hypothetical protein
MTQLGGYIIWVADTCLAACQPAHCSHLRVQLLTSLFLGGGGGGRGKRGGAADILQSIFPPGAHCPKAAQAQSAVSALFSQHAAVMALKTMYREHIIMHPRSSEMAVFIQEAMFTSCCSRACSPIAARFVLN